MKFHQLMYFLEAARQEHVGRAARTLAISPSAISHSIAALEEELGRELFIKQGKRIALTNHGKLLLERVAKLAGELESIKGELASDEVALLGSYRIAASHFLSPQLLVPAWGELKSRAPRVQAEIYTLRSAEVLTGTLAGEFDLGICFSPQSHAALVSRTLLEGQLVVGVRRGHPVLKIKDPLKRLTALNVYPAALAKSFRGIENCESHPILESSGIVPNVELVFDSYEVALARVAGSDTWSLLPDWVIERYGLVALRGENWNAPYSICAVWPKVRPLTKAMVELVEWMAKQAARH